MKITPVELAERVEEWQERLSPLGLAHFRIKEVSVTDDVPGKFLAHAGVSIDEDYDSCRFYFHAGFVEGASAKELDETILHEWMHVAMRDLNNATNLARPWMPEATWETYDTNLDHHKESLVEGLARSMYYLHKPKSHPRTTL